MKLWLPFFCCLLLSGCSTISAPPEDSPTFPLPEPIVIAPPNLEFTLAIYPNESLHPTLVTNQTNHSLAPLLYESLYVLDEYFNPIPLLVDSSQVQNNGYRWVFTLKNDVTLWNGSPLTASMVASALNEARNGHYAPRFYGINSITAYQNLLTIDLATPNWNLPALLDIPISNGGGNYPQGSGPYIYWAEEEILRQNPDWWGTTDLPEQILLEPIHASNDLSSAFDGGNLSLIYGDITGNQSFGYSGNYEVWKYHSTNLIYLGFDTTNPKLNATLRQIISLSISRDTLVSQCLAGYGTATMFPHHPATGLSLPPWSYDPIASAESYFYYGNLPALRLLVHDENQEKLMIAQEIAQQLENYGLSIEICPLPWADYLLALQEKNFDLYLGEIYLTSDFNTSSLLSSWGEYNYGQYFDSYADSLWEEFRSQGITEENADWHYFHYFYSQMPIAPLCFKEGTALSLWGHLSQANPTAHHLCYELEQWVVEQVQEEISAQSLAQEHSDTLPDSAIIEE